METQELIFTNDVTAAIASQIDKLSPSGLFILADSNTERLVLPKLRAEHPALINAKTITIPAGDDHKNVDSLTHIWSNLVEGGANRRSLLLNLGGGVVTDIGGFAAATFKRGIRFINIPTTLLSAVDAAVGGKTGINFHGFKNEIGAFCNASTVIISTRFFDTLPAAELLSGFAEMLKHSLLDGPTAFAKTISFDIADCDYDQLLPLVKESVEVKKKIVEIDPTERGLRKALNLGHTAAHAFESLAFSRNRPVAHGYAVAWGLVVDLILSHQRLGFPSDALHSVASFVKEHYGAPELTCDDYPVVIDYMKHDKKNILPGRIEFSLLESPGAVALGQIVEADEITVALDIFRDFVG